MNPLFCPACQRLNQKSRVYSEGGSSTLLYNAPYYDENGKYHNHDPNWYNTSYHCSEGHSFSISCRTSCASCDFGSEEPTVTEHSVAQR
jgi:hypothetical protein